MPRTSLTEHSIVHVCPFRVSHYADQLASISQSLSEEEGLRARRFVKEADRCRFILGRAIVRHLCGTHLHIEPASVRLGQTLAGKPYLADPIPPHQKRFEFSVAHSGNYVLVAWAEGQTMGVDVEAVDRHLPALIKDVSASAFSPIERHALFAAAPNEFASVFYRIWVRKEALLKAEGCGLSEALQSFSVVHCHLGCTEWPDEVISPVSGRSWAIADLVSSPDHPGALALPHGSTMYEHKSHEVISWKQG